MKFRADKCVDVMLNLGRCLCLVVFVSTSMCGAQS
jgi:hypothetical protein